MDPKILENEQEYGVVKLTHHAAAADRAAAMRRRPGRPLRRPECFVIGHAWSDDPAREGGTMCMVCQVVRWP